MKAKKQNVSRTGALIGMVAATFLTLGSTAWADPDMGGHHGMPMGDHCHGMRHGMEHAIQPHNAATDFLKMSSALKLSDEQIKKLTKLRDEYIDKNAKTEEQLKVSYGDVARTIFADDMNVNEADNLIDKVGKMESQLWHAYIAQINDIKALLTAEQKQSLKAKWSMHPHGQDKMHGDMPMDKGM